MKPPDGAGCAPSARYCVDDFHVRWSGLGEFCDQALMSSGSGDACCASGGGVLLCALDAAAEADAAATDCWAQVRRAGIGCGDDACSA